MTVPRQADAGTGRSTCHVESGPARRARRCSTASPSRPFRAPSSTSPRSSDRTSSQRAIDQAEVLRLTDPLSLPQLLERYPRPPRREQAASGCRGRQPRRGHHPQRARGALPRVRWRALVYRARKSTRRCRLAGRVDRGRLPLAGPARGGRARRPRRARHGRRLRARPRPRPSLLQSRAGRRCVSHGGSSSASRRSSRRISRAPPHHLTSCHSITPCPTASWRPPGQLAGEGAERLQVVAAEEEPPGVVLPRAPGREGAGRRPARGRPRTRAAPTSVGLAVHPERCARWTSARRARRATRFQASAAPVDRPADARRPAPDRVPRVVARGVVHERLVAVHAPLARAARARGRAPARGACLRVQMQARPLGETTSTPGPSSSARSMLTLLGVHPRPPGRQVHAAAPAPVHSWSVPSGSATRPPALRDPGHARVADADHQVRAGRAPRSASASAGGRARAAASAPEGASIRAPRTSGPRTGKGSHAREYTPD